MEKQIIEIGGKKYEVTLVPVEEVKEVNPKRISGFFVNNICDIIEESNILVCKETRNIFRTEEQAEACIAMAQLSQLMYEANEWWEPDWTNQNQRKYCIEFNYDKIVTSLFNTTSHFLAFKTSEIAEKFAKENKELILTAKPLM